MFNKLVYGLIVLAFVLYPLNPLLTAIIPLGMFLALWFKLKLNGGDIFVVPTRPGETPLIWITRSRKISLVKAFDKAEGYMGLPRWGTIRVVPDSDYVFAGKKTMIGVEGINHTVRLENVKLTEKLAQKGWRTLQEARDAYGIPTPTGEEHV